MKIKKNHKNSYQFIKNHSYLKTNVHRNLKEKDFQKTRVNL